MAKLSSIALGVTICVGQDTFLTKAPAAPAPRTNNVKDVRGAALNGLLQFEDWFFSWPEGLPPLEPYPFDEVSSGPQLPQGRLFPSNVVAKELVDPWLSEGGLIGTTASRIGDEATIAAMTVHRESYITEYDFAHMAAHGIQHVRLAFGWWVFASNPATVETPALIPDLCYPELRFVTVPGSFLNTLMEQGARHNVSFLFDLHAMPCGASDGTYNGVFPEDPVFFNNESASKLGFEVVHNMMQWWKGLPSHLQASVHGFTVLNEPGLGVVGDGLRPGVTGLASNASIVAWLKQAVGIFSDYALADDHMAPPLLYMNLHEAAFPAVPGSSSLNQMASVYADIGLPSKDWAVFDVHHYFAWAGVGNGIPAEKCSTDEDLNAYVQEGMNNFTGNMKGVAKQYDIANIACSEWSLSLHHKDHVAPCTAPSSLAIMHDVQVQAFKDAGMGHFFWGWRMPTGGTHEQMWSLKLHYTGLH